MAAQAARTAALETSVEAAQRAVTGRMDTVAQEAAQAAAEAAAALGLVKHESEVRILSCSSSQSLLRTH